MHKHSIHYTCKFPIIFGKRLLYFKLVLQYFSTASYFLIELNLLGL